MATLSHVGKSRFATGKWLCGAENCKHDSRDLSGQAYKQFWADKTWQCFHEDCDVPSKWDGKYTTTAPKVDPKDEEIKALKAKLAEYESLLEKA